MSNFDVSNQPLRILAVDDYPDNLFLIEVILDSPRYHLALAQNGAEALEQISQSPPDILILDLMMPGMSGYEVAQRIRQNQSLPYISILLATASGEANHNEALQFGINDFICKPFDIEELESKIEFLRRAHVVAQQEGSPLLDYPAA